MSAKERWLRSVERWRLHPEAPGGDDCWAPELERAPAARLEEIHSADRDARALVAGVVAAVRREVDLEVGCEVVAAGTLRRVEAKARRVHDRRRRVTADVADRRPARLPNPGD